MYESVLKMINVRAILKMWTNRILTNQYQKEYFRKYKIRIAKSRRINIYYEENKSTTLSVYYLIERKQILTFPAIKPIDPVLPGVVR